MPDSRSVVSAAVLALILVAQPAFAQYSYEVTYQLDYGPKFDPSLGGCYSGLAVVPCGQYFTNLNNGYYNPIDRFALGQYSSVDLAVVGRSGPIEVVRSAQASFAMLLGKDLVKAYAASEGSRSVTNCPAPGCHSAVAHAYPIRVQLRVDETIFGTIPDTLDGQDVFLKLSLPVTAFGEGSSTGELSFRLGDDSESASFGSFNVTGPAYSFAQTFVLTTLVRPASSSSHDFAVPFRFYGSFLSSTNNGPGKLDALNSVGFIPDLSEGLSLRSASGQLDALLAPQVAAVPEPQSYALMFAGLGLIGIAARRLRRGSS